MSSFFYLLASCAIMPLCKRGKLVLHNFHVAAGAPPRQLATLYNDINGFYNGLPPVYQCICSKNDHTFRVASYLYFFNSPAKRTFELNTLRTADRGILQFCF